MTTGTRTRHRFLLNRSLRLLDLPVQIRVLCLQLDNLVLELLNLARLFGGRWLPSCVLAVVLGVGLYFLFDRVLEVPLPLGVLSALEI